MSPALKRKVKEEYQYTLEIIEMDKARGGGFLALCHDVPGCSSTGKTPDEALKNGFDAVKSFLAALRKWNMEIPPPNKPSNLPIGKKRINTPEGQVDLSLRYSGKKNFKNDGEHAAYIEKRFNEFHGI